MHIEVCEIDLQQDDRVVGPARVLVRDGTWLLGEAWVPTGQTVQGADLAVDVAAALYARRVLRAGPPSSRWSAADVTAVVCTRDRPDLLDGCLHALRALRPPAGDVLVVDSASATGATQEVARAHGVRVVREEQPGLDRARNLGWQHAGTALVAYVDDDARVDVGWAAAVAQAFHHDAVGLVTGLVLPAELVTAAQARFERLGGMGKGFTPVARVAADVELATFHLGVGAAMAARRDVLQAVDGFDPCLDVGTATGGGGDLEGFWRVLDAGWTALYWPQMAVRHLHRRDDAGWVKQMRGNGSGYNAYLEAVAARSPALARAVRRQRVRWHLQRHVKDLLRALAARDRDRCTELWAEGTASVRGPGAYRRARAEPAVPSA